MGTTAQIKSVSDLDSKIAPGFAQLWRKIKASTGSTVRRPKVVLITDEPSPMYPNDCDCARRFAVDLVTMEILGETHVSCGEWAIANKGQELAVRGIPRNHAVVSCCWNDYHRYFSMTVEVAPGTVPAQIEA